jgi:2-hydroxychromene-2-carboxylate isomerase
MLGPIDFHFDYLSPYAYLAWTRIHTLAERHGRAVRPVPTLLAALLEQGKTKGPAEIPAKRAYVGVDILRIAHGYGVAIGPPPAHPFNPLLALRASSLDMDEGARRRLVDGLYRSTWGGDGPGAEAPDVVARIATAAGLDGADIVRRAAEQDAKERLKRQTADAVAVGVFGVPTMRVDGAIFWGCDSLPHLEGFLRGEDPVDPAILARWAVVKPSATRR